MDAKCVLVFVGTGDFSKLNHNDENIYFRIQRRHVATVNYQPYLDITRPRGAYFPPEVRKLEIPSRLEASKRASEQGSTERFIGSERRKNVEEVVTLAENCDCPVKLRVLYSLYFLRTVSSSLLPPSLVWFPSSPLLLLFFSLFSSHVGIYARHHCLITMLGLHVAEGVHLVGRMRGEEETCSSDSHAPGRQHHWFKANSPRLNYRRPRS